MNKRLEIQRNSQSTHGRILKIGYTRLDMPVHDEIIIRTKYRCVSCVG